MKFSSTPNTTAQQVPQPPISEKLPPYSVVAPSFSENTTRSRSTKWQTVLIPILVLQS